MPHRAFYNNKLTFPTSHFLGEWADLAAAATFWFSMINAANLVVFLHKRWFPFLGPRKERLHSYQAHLFMQQPDNTAGRPVTSHINTAI